MHIIKRTLKKKQAIDTSEMPPAEISESILFEAFRTITTILSYIHSPSRRFSSETGPIGDGYDDREALKVLDALSAVLIRDHEIVAVVAPPYNEFLLQPGSDDQTRSLWGLFWATLNPRTSKIYGNTDSLQNNTSLPLIGDYEDKVPINLITAAKENAPVLEVFLQSHW
jgi:hypothetical protein